LAGMIGWMICALPHMLVVNHKDAFMNYQPLKGKQVQDVSNLVTQAEGQGTVQIELNISGKKYISTLDNVLYIPTNRYNLLALKWWDKFDGHIEVHHRKLSLITDICQVAAIGEWMNANLYQMNVKVLKPDQPCDTSIKTYAYTTHKSPQSWEIWHRQFGHISYEGLKYLLDKELVDGLQVDEMSSKPNYQACTEAKQSIRPFFKKAKHWSDKNGQLTYIDSLRKFPVVSIDGSQYFINFVDDKSQIVTIEGLKHKNEATQKVKDYLTHLQTHGMTPQAVCFNEGGEFISKELSSWFKEHRITVQETTPYSPSQNGVAERMNYTQQLPIFLCLHAVQHAAYLYNRAHTRALDNITPLEYWTGEKPNVSHL